MTRDQLVETIEMAGAVAVVRMADTDRLFRVIDAIREGGVTAIEITMTTPNALHVIETMAQKMGDVVHVGVGSVITPEVARQAISAGAQYVVSPVFKPDVITATHALGKPIMPGAFTPTEIQAAWEAGADVIKVFPASMFGPKFIKAVKAPLPHLKLMPTGGVTPENAGTWVQAGCCAVGIGSALLDKQAIAEENYPRLTELARILMARIAEARDA